MVEDIIACLPAKSVERQRFSSAGGTILAIWLLDIISLLQGFPWEIQLRTSLLSKARGSVWHPQPKMLKLWVWPLNGAL